MGMIRGIDTFRERFRDYEDALVLIGGAACDDWFTRQGLTFRATKDLDIVLILKAVDLKFIAALRQFIGDGGYEIRMQSEGLSPMLYRFAKPADKNFPHMLEIFSRLPEGIDLSHDQTIVPIPVDEVAHSLSAILVDDLYHDLIREFSEKNDGIAFANATALIPLKAKAWLDLTERSAVGKHVNSKDIDKHRNDVFRLAGTLPGATGPEVSSAIQKDLSRFLNAIAEDPAAWPAMLASIKQTLGGNVKPSSLIAAIRTHFDL